MGFATTLGEHLWFARTPFLLLAFFVISALARRVHSVERYHTRAATTLIIGHLTATVIGAAVDYQGYEDTIADVAALAFELLAWLTLGMTLLFRVLLPRVGLTLPRILIDIITVVGVVIVFIIVGQRAGFSVAGLITTSAVLTAVLGFAMQDTLGSVMGGLSMQLDKSIKVGDWISLGKDQPTGRVVEIRWRYTAIETRNWDTVIIPNGHLVKSQVTIFGKRIGEPLQTRRQVEFFIDFRTPPTEVIAAVEAALRRDPPPGIATTPPPNCLFFGVKDSYASYLVRYWITDLASDDPPDSAVRVRIWYALRRADISMSIPASTIFLTPNTPERVQSKASAELDRRMGALAAVDLFRGLPEELRRELAGKLEYAPFARGEVITHEGDEDDELYMLLEGHAAVRIGSGADEREVARLSPGQFFGEMSLMTGETRTATVIAGSDVVCYRLDKPAFQFVLKEMPALADQIAEVLAQRRSALTIVRDERDEVKRSRVETAKQDLLGRIRGFFGIQS